MVALARLNGWHWDAITGAELARDYKPKGWNAVIETNLTGTWNMTQVFGVPMLDGEGGAIVNVIAVVGRGFPGIAHTGAARAGVAELSLPPGRYRVLNLSPSTPGGLPDAAFEAELSPQARDLALDPTAAAVTTLELAAKVAEGTDVADWSTDARVGQGLPQLEVKKWLLGHPQPKDLKGQVLLLYVWATWCGPCRMTAPAVAQVAARLKHKPVHIVAASIDRDEAALDEYARDELPGAPAIAWIGPDGMDKLGLDSVPTFIAVDGTGRIRGLRKGGGWSPDALATWLEKVLDGTPK